MLRRSMKLSFTEVANYNRKKLLKRKFSVVKAYNCICGTLFSGDIVFRNSINTQQFDQKLRKHWKIFCLPPTNLLSAEKFSKTFHIFLDFL